MSMIAPTLQAFFSDRLARQLQASPRTIASYRDTLRLLLCFAQETTGKTPSSLDWDDLNETLISSFLAHLEQNRHNSARTRNLRLTAIRSLFRYAALRHPEHAAVIARVLSIPPKRFERRTVTFLTAEESRVLIEAPDRTRWEGRRDRAMLTLAIQAGLRVSELIGLGCADIVLGTGAHVRCKGKGRKQRSVPQATLRAAHSTGAGSVVHMAHRESRRPARPTVLHPHRQAAEPRRDRTTPGDPHQGRNKAVPIAERQAVASARAQAQLRDVTAASRGRHDRDRVVARARRCPLHAALSPRRPHDQGTRARPRHTNHHHTRPLQTTRHHACLPRRTVTMPTIQSAKPSQSPSRAGRSPPRTRPVGIVAVSA